jgi:hypothetical protein
VTFERMSGCVQCRGRSRNPRLRSKRVESGAGCCLTGEVPAVTAIPATEFRHLIRCRRLGSRGHVLSERRVLARRRERPHQRRSRVRREIKNRRTQDFDALRPASRLPSERSNFGRFGRFVASRVDPNVALHDCRPVCQRHSEWPEASFEPVAVKWAGKSING